MKLSPEAGKRRVEKECFRQSLSQQGAQTKNVTPDFNKTFNNPLLHLSRLSFYVIYAINRKRILFHKGHVFTGGVGGGGGGSLWRAHQSGQGYGGKSQVVLDVLVIARCLAAQPACEGSGPRRAVPVPRILRPSYGDVRPCNRVSPHEPIATFPTADTTTQRTSFFRR